MKACVVCSTPLRGKQGKFCGRRCKNRYTNYHHQSYRRQQQRGRERKVALIAMLGGEGSLHELGAAIDLVDKQTNLSTGSACESSTALS